MIDNVKFPFKFGLDLAGGSQLTYSADVSKIAPEEIPELMEVLRVVIEKRINIFGNHVFLFPKKLKRYPLARHSLLDHNLPNPQPLKHTLFSAKQSPWSKRWQSFRARTTRLALHVT